jgi:hypothetical protein
MNYHSTRSIASGCRFFCLALALALAFPAPDTACAYAVDECIACHRDVHLTKRDDAGAVRSLYVDKEEFMQSVHAELGYTCVTCHEDATADTHPARGLKKVTCIECHDEVAALHSTDPHGKAAAAGNPDAPQCYDCHSTHSVLPSTNPGSTVHRDNLVLTCGACHPDQAGPALITLARAYATGEQHSLPFPGFMTTLFSGVPSRLKGHGKVNMAEDYSTQRCGSCHIDVIHHSGQPIQADICAECHWSGRPRLFFGTIHKADTVKSPLLLSLLVLLYLGGIAGMIFFLRATFRKKTTADASDADTSQSDQ